MYARAGLIVITVKDWITGQEGIFGLNGPITAITANNPRLGRAKVTPASMANKGRPEQG